ncbi:MAG: class I SAM-dependent methyltransferase [Pseudonocardiales bacterium]|nr:class I SAM-dependent methyltransferase [Pseudonocardiales bacterium]
MPRPTAETKSGVPEAFDAAARGYDRLVGANPGYHDHLRLSAQRMRLPNKGRGLRLLDVGCGTGASTAALLAVVPRAQIVGMDGSAGMIARARAKVWPPSVTFVHAKIEELADTEVGRAATFDGILAAYLVRNLPDPDAGLCTLLELLRPGAPLAVHDYSVADSRRARVVWTAVCWTVIIPAGTLVARSAGLYRYLWDSVRDFDGVAAFERRLGRAGFEDLRTHTMPGWQRHVVHTFLGRRPDQKPAS